MEEPAFRGEYTAAEDEFALIETLIRTRAAAKLARAKLAERLGTTQSAIARLDDGRVSQSFATLRRHAAATGTRLKVAIEQPGSIDRGGIIRPKITDRRAPHPVRNSRPDAMTGTASHRLRQAVSRTNAASPVTE